MATHRGGVHREGTQRGGGVHKDEEGVHTERSREYTERMSTGGRVGGNKRGGRGEWVRKDDGHRRKQRGDRIRWTGAYAFLRHQNDEDVTGCFLPVSW